MFVCRRRRPSAGDAFTQTTDYIVDRPGLNKGWPKWDLALIRSRPQDLLPGSRSEEDQRQ